MQAGDVVYLNGSFLPRGEARVGLEERGLMFGDGVYEVLRIYGGRPFRLAEHERRFRASLEAVEIDAPAALDEFAALSEELVARNGMADASLYWEITRGTATRDPVYPDEVEPTLFALCYPQPPLRSGDPAPLSTVIVPDERWHRCSVKSLMLLPNVMARNAAARAGCDAAILCRGDVVTEASSANLAIVRHGEVWTHPTGDWILDGITRQVLLECAAEAEIPVVETSFRRHELVFADEVFLCGTTTHVAGVGSIDGHPTRRPAPGPITRELSRRLVERIARECALELV